MSWLRLTLTAAMLAALTMATGCGRKGDPTPPTAVEEEDGDKADGGEMG